MPVISLPEKLRPCAGGGERDHLSGCAVHPLPARSPIITPKPARKSPLIAGLRRRIEALERPAPRAGVAPLSLGLPAVDRALPGGGLKPGALHEMQGAGAALAFIAALAARRLRQGMTGPVLWCRIGANLYPPGLAAFGLAADDLILVRGRRMRDVLWAMEEGLTSGKPAIVVGEAERLDLTAGRRLQLAAEAGGMIGLLLAPGGKGGEASAAVTRWRLDSLPSAPTAGYRGVGRARFSAALLRCRGGVPGRWVLEWDDATHTFAVAAALGDGPVLPRRQAAGR